MFFNIFYLLFLAFLFYKFLLNFFHLSLCYYFSKCRLFLILKLVIYIFKLFVYLPQQVFENFQDQCQGLVKFYMFSFVLRLIHFKLSCHHILDRNVCSINRKYIYYNINIFYIKSKIKKNWFEN